MPGRRSWSPWSWAVSSVMLAMASPARGDAGDTGELWQDAPALGEADAPGETIYVEDEAVSRARGEVVETLKGMGYEKKATRSGRHVFRHHDRWKPQVVISDDGWMRVRRTPPSLGKPDLPGVWGGPLGYLVCVANPTACVHVGGMLVGKRKLAWQKTAVVEGFQPTMSRYQEALARREMTDRLDSWLPSAIEALWEEGRPLDGGDEPLEQWEDRRAALLEFWSTRLHNPWGESARELVELFVIHVVQESPHPFPEEALTPLRASLEARVAGEVSPGEGEQEQ